MLKTDVLHRLEAQKGQIVTGGQLAEALGVSRTAVWKAIHALQLEGNEITSHRNSGYQLMETNDTLLLPAIRSGLTTSFVGRSLDVLQTVHSTNQYLKELPDAPNGHVVVADGQTAGRGRHGRSFLSQNRGGAYISILIRPGADPMDTRFLTICAAVAVAGALESVCGIDAGIKWVNDIYCGGKKICGILTEAQMSAELQEIESAVVGIGINTECVPDEIQGIATSVFELTGQRGVRNRLIAEVLNRFEPICLNSAAEDGKRRILAEYRRRLFIVGQRVLVKGARTPYIATVCGIDESGGLIVRDDGGTSHHIISGEIELMKEQSA